VIGAHSAGGEALDKPAVHGKTDAVLNRCFCRQQQGAAMADEHHPNDLITIRSSVVSDFIGTVWGKVLAMVATIMVLLGVGAEAVVLYSQKFEAAIKTEIAVNADKRQAAEARVEQQKARIAQEAATNARLLEQAKAAKATAEAHAAYEVAVTADIRQKAEAKYARQMAIIEKAKATYAERIKRAEADKLQQEALAQKEVADNSDVKLRAEAQALDIEAKITDAGALNSQWRNNCQQITMRTGMGWARDPAWAFGYCGQKWVGYLVDLPWRSPYVP
jgi:hypothetical protein